MLFPKPHFTETTTFDRGEDMQLTSNNRHSRAESESKVMDYASMSGSVMGHRGGGEDNNVLDEWNCNVHDRKDMARLGKTQQLKRIFGSWGIFSFVVLLMSTWEFNLTSASVVLTDGGRAGYIWTTLVAIIGLFFVALSFAEMASMAPTAGGMYHWVAEFAPVSMRRFLSYITGWVSTLSWNAGNAAALTTFGFTVQCVIYIFHNDYSAPAWHVVLIAIVLSVIVLLVNLYPVRTLPMLGKIFILLHFGAFLGIFILFFTKAPLVSAKVAFTEFYNGGIDGIHQKWSSVGLAVMVGQLSSIFNMIGIDVSTHMAEEVRDASLVVPRTVVRAYGVSAFMSMLIVIAMAFSIPNVADSLSDSLKPPFIYILEQTTSPGGAAAVVVLIALLFLIICLFGQTIAGRMTFAFARDHGLPFSPWVSRVNRRTNIPTNAMIVNCIFTALLSLIYLGSIEAFDSVVAIASTAALLSYGLAIASLMYFRMRNAHVFPKLRWTLGRWGMPCNVLALIYCIWATFWTVWPTTVVKTASDMNWVIIVVTGVILLATILYFWRGRYLYNGPQYLTKALDRM